MERVRQSSTDRKEGNMPLANSEAVRERQARAKRYAARRVDYPRKVMDLWKGVMRERFLRTRELANFRGFRGDFHTHSNHSDGAGTVAELAHFRDAAGLDFLFVTDHSGLSQKRDCLRFERMWWGQEPGTQHHHLGILGLTRKFVPAKDLMRDYAAIKRRGGIPFIPHPCGWFPTTRYTEEQIAALDTLDDAFIMEIVNGANQIFDCWDVTDAQSVELWDRLLCAGKRVTALGNTDAHLAEAIGDIWTGVLAGECTHTAILDALRMGRVFVSDAPVIDISVQCDGSEPVGMGGTLFVPPSKRNSPLVVRILAADSAGLASVSLVGGGMVLESWNVADKAVLSVSFVVPTRQEPVYFRCECRSTDGRRAFSNAVYVVRKTE